MTTPILDGAAVTGLTQGRWRGLLSRSLKTSGLRWNGGRSACGPVATSTPRGLNPRTLHERAVVPC